jgi:predicted  nucleic acid-binding Zn-ribbon protein
MASIGQKFDEDTRLVCSRCGHMMIVRAGSIVKPCPTCMNIEFELAESGEKPEVTQPADIGLSFDELQERTNRVLRSKSGLNRMQVDAISEAVAHSIEQNNRKLQQDIEAAFRELTD